MRPAFKFLKHIPRGLKEVKGTGLVEEIAKSEKISEPSMDGPKRLTPLKFKSR